MLPESLQLQARDSKNVTATGGPRWNRSGIMASTWEGGQDGGPGMSGTKDMWVNEWLHRGVGELRRLDTLLPQWGEPAPKGSGHTQQYLCLIYNWNLIILAALAAFPTDAKKNFSSLEENPARGTILCGIENLFYACQCLQKFFECSDI